MGWTTSYRWSGYTRDKIDGMNVSEGKVLRAIRCERRSKYKRTHKRTSSHIKKN